MLRPRRSDGSRISHGQVQLRLIEAVGQDQRSERSVVRKEKSRIPPGTRPSHSSSCVETQIGLARVIAVTVLAATTLSRGAATSARKRTENGSAQQMRFEGHNGHSACRLRQFEARAELLVAAATRTPPSTAERRHRPPGSSPEQRQKRQRLEKKSSGNGSTIRMTEISVKRGP